MNQARLVVLGVALAGSVLLACTGSTGGSGDDNTNPAVGNLGWDSQTNIEAIFESSCAGCHGAQWSSCWNVQASAADVDSMVSSGAMPRSGALSTSDKSTLLDWLGKGAPCTGPREPTTTGGTGPGPVAPEGPEVPSAPAG